jgi:hypothetical protein
MVSRLPSYRKLTRAVTSLLLRSTFGLRTSGPCGAINLVLVCSHNFSNEIIVPARKYYCNNNTKMKLHTTLSLLALPILTCSAWRSHGTKRETIEVVMAAMEANVHSYRPGSLIAKLGRNLEISQDCIDDTTDLYLNSEALQDMHNYIDDNVDFDCKLADEGKTYSAVCSVRYPESLVDEIVDVCEVEGGQPVRLPDFIISCDGTYEGVNLKTSIAYTDAVECVALGCDVEDFELEAILIPELEEALRREVGIHDAYCWVEEDKDGGLSGGAIAGIVIGSIFGAALLLFILFSCLRK